MDQPPGEAPSCYRHSGVRTGVRCTRCERPICPECMISASVGFQCPECVRRGSGTGHSPTASRPRTVVGGTVAGDPRLVTKILVAVNVIVFIIAWRSSAFVDQFDLVGAALDRRTGQPVGVADGQWYRLVTSTFLHQAVWHIGFNMLSLWWIGGPLEAQLGRARYLTLYLISGVGGSALTYLLAAPNAGSLGASGAIFGLFGATAVLMRKLRYDLRPVIGLLVVNLIFTFSFPDIAWEAHVGGLVAGTLVAIGLVHAPRERRNLVQYGTAALVLAAAVGIIVARTAALT